MDIQGKNLQAVAAKARLTREGKPKATSVMLLMRGTGQEWGQEDRVFQFRYIPFFHFYIFLIACTHYFFTVTFRSQEGRI